MRSGDFSGTSSTADAGFRCIDLRQVPGDRRQAEVDSELRQLCLDLPGSHPFSVAIRTIRGLRFLGKPVADRGLALRSIASSRGRPCDASGSPSAPNYNQSASPMGQNRERATQKARSSGESRGLGWRWT